MAKELEYCHCHNIDKARFVFACQSGAQSVKTCFKAVGCLPKCNNCIPMVRRLLDEQKVASVAEQ